MSRTTDTATQLGAQAPEAAVVPRDRVRIKLTKHWDAALTYDVLKRDADADIAPPPFVGRRELLGALVNAIEQPDRRGTYLVSGYRGAGKTSLVIEAARNARQNLEKEDRRLLPVVLNVSEVSASLSDAAEGVAPPLQIDARRLLTALLRALRNNLREPKDPSRNARAVAKVEKTYRLTLGRNWLAARTNARNGTDSLGMLVDRINGAYRIANATKYVEQTTQGRESRSRWSTESRLGVSVPNALTIVAALAGVLAVGFGAGALLSGAVGIVAAFGAAAVVAFTYSRKVSREAAATDSTKAQLITDYSIHQLENDLKDILTDLQAQNLRTIVVLEELDKVDDAAGKQLDAVIRYFKNLFTQAPALFFFLTDKQYYDVVAKKIEEARRQRTYSVEHTFFTHRVFVNRPTVSDCLEYLKTVARDADQKEAIDEIIKADGHRVRELKNMDLREKFLRLLLFRAQNHIFDLKNEMRRYVQVENGVSSLVCDDDVVAPSEQAMAAYQFLVEQKARAHGFHGGGEYANEVLRNCLFAVVAESEPGQVVPVERLYPAQRGARDQLTPNEERRIREAVDALIRELKRGGVVDSDPATGGIKWIDTAARFTPKAEEELEDYEKDLVEKLTAHAQTLRSFVKGGVLHRLVPSGATADDLQQRLDAKAKEPATSKAPLTRDETNATLSEFEGEVARAVGDAFEAHRKRLEARLSVSLTPIEPGVAGSAWRLPPESGETQPQPIVYFVYGSSDLVRQATASHFASLPPTQRLAVVNVVAPTEPWTAQVDAVTAQWRTMLGEETAARALISVLPLDEGLDVDDAEQRWTEATADELVFASAWVVGPGGGAVNEPPVPPSAGPYVARDSAGEAEHPSFAAAFEGWLSGTGEAICWIAPPMLDAVAETFTRPIDGRFIAAVPATAAVALVGTSPDEQARLESRWRLIAAGRVVVLLDPPALRRLSFVKPVRATLGPPPERSIAGWPKHGRIAVAWDGPPDELLAHIASPAAVTTVRSADGEKAPIALANLIRPWDAEHARALLVDAADAGSPAAMHKLTVDAAERGNVDELRGWVDRLIGSDDANEIESAGDSVRERAVAQTLYEAAAERGSAAAMRKLVMILSERDREAASSWTKRLVDTRNRREIERLADGVRATDRDQARRLYEAAAELGSPTAMRHLILDLHDSEPEHARELIERLLESGDVAEIKHVASAVLEQHPDDVRDWVVLATMADTKPEARSAIAEVVRSVDPKAAERLESTGE